MHKPEDRSKMSAETVDSEIEEIEREIEACRRLAGRDASIAPADLTALRAELDASIAAERGLSARLRERPTSHRIAMVVGLTALLVAITALLAPRSDLAAY